MSEAPFSRAWEFLLQTAGVAGALVALVEIRKRARSCASDCLFGFAVEFDGLPNDDSGSERCCRLLLVHVCKGQLERLETN